MTPRKTFNELVAADDLSEMRDWITSGSISELTQFIHWSGRKVKYTSMTELAKAELDIRLAEASERVHWTVTPGFIVAVLAMIFAAIAAWPVLLSWFQH